MKEKELTEELTEETVLKWLRDHKKIFYKLVEDSKYSGPCRAWSFEIDYMEYKNDVPFNQKFKVGCRDNNIWYTKIESYPYKYLMKNPYDDYYTVFYSYRDPQLVDLENEHKKHIEDLERKLHTHWWK